MIGSDSKTLVQVLHIALFGRPADPTGLKNMAALIDKLPGNLEQVASAMAISDEAYAIFGGYASARQVDILVQNMFGHPPTTAMRGALASALEQGGYDLGGLVALAMAVVTPADLAALEAKVTAAQSFTSALDNTVEMLAYHGERAHLLAHDFLSQITDNASRLQFASQAAVDALVAKMVGIGPVPVSDAIHTQVQEMYVAFFGRAADHNGLEYWSALFKGAPSDSTQDLIASAFGQAKEYTSLFAGKTEAQVVATVYQNLFGRAGETAGIDYWSGLLKNGAIAVHNVVKAISEGAKGSDLYAFDAKVKVASAISNAMDQEAEWQTYVGLERSKIVHDYIATVKDPASYAAAIDPKAIDKLVEVIVTGLGQWDYAAPGAGLVGIAPPDGTLLM
jgi:hypothetical protein